MHRILMKEYFGAQREEGLCYRTSYNYAWWYSPFIMVINKFIHIKIYNISGIASFLVAEANSNTNTKFCSHKHISIFLNLILHNCYHITTTVFSTSKCIIHFILNKRQQPVWCRPSNIVDCISSADIIQGNTHSSETVVSSWYIIYCYLLHLSYACLCFCYINTFTAIPITWKVEVYCMPMPALSTCCHCVHKRQYLLRCHLNAEKIWR
jgi:hypothetical protein